MLKDDEIRLRHMLDAAREAVSFARDRVRGDLETDRQLVLSLVKDIEIVGEAAAQITEPTRMELSDIPWVQIVAIETGLFMRISALTSMSSGKPCGRTCRH